MLGEHSPEIVAGGFTRDDGTMEFYLRVRSLLKQDGSILDLGAGRGAQALEAKTDFLRKFVTLRGDVARVVGADVDPVVLENPFVDEGVVIKVDEPLPFADATFDLIISDWVLEHVHDPSNFVREAHRVLRSGGWFCARTPSKYAYFALGARLLPDRAEKAALSVVQPGRKSVDVFPKHYLLNTMSALRRHFAAREWNLVAYHDNPPPSYTGGSGLLRRVLSTYQCFCPSVLLIYAQKL